jgi:hypothetical protein
MNRDKRDNLWSVALSIWWAAQDADAEAAAQHAQIGDEAAWAGLGGAALELKDRRLGAVLSGWRGRRRWHRS